jgi:hypothetical protein
MDVTLFGLRPNKSKTIRQKNLKKIKFYPLKHGYELMVDLFEDEISTLLSKGGKRAGRMQPPAKKQRTEDWVENPNEFAKRRVRLQLQRQRRSEPWRPRLRPRRQRWERLMRRTEDKGRGRPLAIDIPLE